jgi:hypothetical protein
VKEIRVVVFALILFTWVAFLPTVFGYQTALSIAGPQEIYPGMATTFTATVKNVGSSPMRADNVGLSFDWLPSGYAYLASDVPQVIASGSSHSWSFPIEVPDGVTTNTQHVVQLTVHISDPDSSGGWIPNPQPATSSWLWQVIPQPVAIAWSGTVGISPVPVYQGQTETFAAKITNEGSAPFRVTRIELTWDWGTYDSGDTPQILQPGSSYTFTMRAPVPDNAVGSHAFQVWFWAETPTAGGLWSPDTQIKLAENSFNVEEAQQITGPTTMTFPTQTLSCSSASSECYIIMEGSTIGTISMPTPTPTSPTNLAVLIEAVIVIAIFAALVAILYFARKKRGPSATSGQTHLPSGRLLGGAEA